MNSGWGRGRTLEDAFDPRNNSLNALRLLLAAAVIVSHAWPATGAGGDPSIAGVTLGGAAVAAFFIISGFLITRSRERRGLGRYLWDRFLRIYPGYLVSMSVCAFVLAPLSVLLATGTVYELRDGMGFVLRNLLLSAPFFKQTGIGNTVGPVTGLPWTGFWNGPVWTLFYEGVCYLAVALVMSLVPRRWLGGVFVGLAVLTTAWDWAVRVGQLPMPAGIPNAPGLFAPFAVGAALYWYRRWVPVGPLAAAVSAVAMLVILGSGHGVALLPWPLAIFGFFLATTLPWQRIGRVHDLSYGVYIYGWPVQMMVMLTILRWDLAVPLAADIVIVIALTLPIAYASARLVEEPALRLKRLGTPRAANQRQVEADPVGTPGPRP